MARIFLHIEGEPDGTITRASLCGSQDSVIISLVAFAASCPDFEAMLVAAAHYVEDQPEQFEGLRRDLEGRFRRNEKTWVEPVVIRPLHRPANPKKAKNIKILGDYTPSDAQKN